MKDGIYGAVAKILYTVPRESWTKDTFIYRDLLFDDLTLWEVVMKIE